MRAEVWLLNDRLLFSIHHCPLWQRGGLHFHENGGRTADQCLDITLVIGRTNYGMTIWRLGRLSWFTRRIPAPRARWGYSFGIPPIGVKPVDEVSAND